MSTINKDYANKYWINENFDEQWNAEQNAPQQRLMTKFKLLTAGIVCLLLSMLIFSKLATATSPKIDPKPVIDQLENLGSPDLISYKKHYPQQIITLYDVE